MYTLDVAPGSLTDQRGRALGGPAQHLRFAFRPVPPRLVWDASQGIVERDGPQMVPVRGHGYAHADVRIHRIDPLDRDFWPFPADGVETRDAEAPPLPGNEPGAWSKPAAVKAVDIVARIKALGSPSVSELMDLPDTSGGDAKFGLDLQPLLARIAGARQPGTYLVGLRALHSPERHWIRLEVTDLSLTTVEEQGRVRFAVTSLATAQPVAGAQLRIEGLEDKDYRVLAEGTTDAQGAFTYVPHDGAQAAPQRIVVQKATDTLVLRTAPGPEAYADGNWTQPRGTWLAWPFTKTAISARAEKPRILCHVFTERPIYRPEEAVEIRGFVRRYLHGALSFASGKGTVLVQGPDKQEWRYPVTLDDTSGFYWHFDAKTVATGDYTVSFQPEHADECDSADFKKEAYRLPTFEVLLNHAQTEPLDAPFQVGLLARYYAGGVVTDRPITWRVTQFPYTWSPPGRPGFLFSSDARFSGDQTFRSTPVMQSNGKTDAGGSAQLTLDPTLEPTAQPRTYMVEATVTGDDGQQIRNVANIPALPPFVLGVKMPRYLPHPGNIAADLLALDAGGKPSAGIDMTVRLIKRDWNSVLQASDFTQGTAKYVTQEIDRTIEERHVSSTAAAQTLNFAAAEAGVYVVEVTAADRLGRRQTLRVDCFMAGDTPVTWSRPPAKTVTVKADKDDYAPGENATLLIESPFQAARALVVTEQPDGVFDYGWVDVADGVGRYTLAVTKQQMPRLPVHVLLMRGRLAGPPPSATAPFDQGKPTTLAATTWVKVRPVQNRVTVAFDAPATARPAQTVEVTLRLSDEGGKPLAGEATFWMVDQAVLALAKEAPLDPLPKFIVERPSRMVARDTRNMAFGIIPLQEYPGGGEGEENPGIANISVRRNFTPVPIYLPHVKVGPDGIAHIQVKLPDTLTVFMLRAEVTSGPDRFGFATGEMHIRQPIVAQPVLPRFLRPGDQFEAAVLGRVVEGPGGAGTVIISVDGLTVTGEKEQKFAWEGTAPARETFPVSVPQPAPGTDVAKIRFLVRRDSDQVGDGVEIALPIRPDRPAVREQRLVEVAPGAAADLPAPPDDVRAGSYAGSLAVATDPALARALGALDYLLAYPFGCTEQRIALASSELALLPFAPIAGAEGLQPRVGADVAAALQGIAQAVDENGLVGYWPHTRGLVTLTAWSVRADDPCRGGAPAGRYRATRPAGDGSDPVAAVRLSAFPDRRGAAGAGHGAVCARGRGKTGCRLCQRTGAHGRCAEHQRAGDGGVGHRGHSERRSGAGGGLAGDAVDARARAGPRRSAGLCRAGGLRGQSSGPAVGDPQSRRGDARGGAGDAGGAAAAAAAFRAGVAGRAGWLGQHQCRCCGVARSGNELGCRRGGRGGDGVTGGWSAPGGARARGADGAMDHDAAGADARGRWRDARGAGVAAGALRPGGARLAGEPGAAWLRTEPRAAAGAGRRRTDGGSGGGVRRRAASGERRRGGGDRGTGESGGPHNGGGGVADCRRPGAAEPEPGDCAGRGGTLGRSDAGADLHRVRR